MRRTYWYILLALMALAAPSASALQLRWSTGSTEITFTGATRCTLVVQADAGAGRFPREWRLLWVADSSSVQLVAPDPTSACLLDQAQVSGLDRPATLSDSAANLTTAHFCSIDNDLATTALQVVDLPTGGRGKFKVIALDPNDPDSARVVESNQVTFNGGLLFPFPAAVLHASKLHDSLRLQVSVVGVGLNSARLLSIAAVDRSWTLPLTIVSQSESAVAGVASVSALLSACEAGVATAGGASSSASLPADPEIQLNAPLSGGCSAQYFEELLLSPPSPLGYEVQPKDFSLTPGFVDAATNRYALHLFYIRHNYWYYQPPDTQAKWHPELDEKNFGHGWTSDLLSWHGPAAGDKTDTTGIKVRAGKFDELHVWAPTIIRKSNGDPTYFMFYTGVRNEGGRENQRIGLATGTNLDSLTQSDSPVLTAPDIHWVRTNPLSYGGSQQLRDPFVMEYPVGSGKYIMYFVAVDSLAHPAQLDSTDDMAVGAATSTDLLHWLPLEKPFAGTLRSTFQGHTHIVESPHVFQRNGQWWMPYTVGQDQVFFETSASPTDTVAGHWTTPTWLRGVSDEEPAPLRYWHATEHLGSGSTEWLAAFNDNAISIDIMGMFPTAYPGVDSVRLYCPPQPPAAGVGGPRIVPAQLRLVVMRSQLGSREVGLRMELPWRVPVRLAVYDVAGRRLATLVNKELPSGVTDVRWGGADEGGGRVPGGIYFVRLTCAKGDRVSKVVMLR